MKALVWKSVAVTLCSGLLGASVTSAFVPDGAEVAPRPHTKPTDEEWLPKGGKDPRMVMPTPKPDNAPEERIDYSSRPTAFPDLREPDLYNMNWNWRYNYLMNRCPLLYGSTEIKIELTDDTQRKLLKARLYQAVTEQHRWLKRAPLRDFYSWVDYQHRVYECFAEIRVTATRLWADQPKELIPWLEEVVLLTKELERYILLRVMNGTSHQTAFHYARRHRLKAEAELWKVKNAK